MEKFLKPLKPLKHLQKNESHLEKKTIEYNDEQLSFINSPLQNCSLLGIPGGGKTASIIGKIIHHHNTGELKDNNDFLILTFSRRACTDFIEKGKLQNKKLFTTKNIRTLHSIAGKIVTHTLNRKSSSQDTIIISAIEQFDNLDCLPKILEINELKNNRVIIVDEAQDISELQYTLITRIANLTNSSLIMVGDPNQNIYQFQNGTDHFLINHSEPDQRYYLIKNYRSTQPIVSFINEFRPWDTLTPKMISAKTNQIPPPSSSELLPSTQSVICTPSIQFPSKKPTLFVNSIPNIIADVIQKIRNSPFPLEDIAIIGPSKRSKPTNDSYVNIGLSLFTNELPNYNIEYIKHYDDVNNTDDMAASNCKRVANHVNLMTIHGAKGLEFKQVFLLNFHTNTFGRAPTQKQYREFKYLWYVGISRAEYDLQIYIDRNKEPLYDLKKCDPALYQLCINNNNNSEKLKFSKELKFKQEFEPDYYSVTDLINNKKYLEESDLLRLNKIFNYTTIETPLYPSPILLKLFLDDNDDENNENNENDNSEDVDIHINIDIDIENILKEAQLDPNQPKKSYMDINNMEEINDMDEYYINDSDELFVENTNTTTFDSKNYTIKNSKNYNVLYGCFMENLFNYYYNLKFKQVPYYVTTVEKMIKKKLIVPEEHMKGYNFLKARCPLILTEIITINTFEKTKNKLNNFEEALYSYLVETVNHNYNEEFFLECYNSVSNYDKNKILGAIDILNVQTQMYADEKDMEKDMEIDKSILLLTIFSYQKQYETAYMWKYDFSEELESLRPYMDNTKKLAFETLDYYQFHVLKSHPKLDIIGVFDMICIDNVNNYCKIVELKFTTMTNIKHILQILLYNMLMNPDFQKNVELEIWNLQTGIKTVVHIEKETFNNFRLLQILSKAIHKKMHDMIFFYDLETTGLIYTGHKFDIIDRYFEEYTTKIVPSAGLLQPVDVPFIPFEITQLTGITVDMVNRSGDEIGQFKRELDEIFAYCYRPIFIAFNGNSFDHVILKNRKLINPLECRLLDSKMIIRLFLDSNASEYSDKSLEKIYSHLFTDKVRAHRAESDVKMMIQIFRKLGIDERKILGIMG